MRGPVRTRKPIVLRNNAVDLSNFDWEVYLLNYPELASRGIRTEHDACQHYKSHGFWEKRSSQVPSSFHAEQYMARHSHLGLKSPREAYLHFMRIGTVVRRAEGFRRTSQAYRAPAATQPRRSVANTPPVREKPSPPLVRPRRTIQSSIVKQYATRQQKSKTIMPSFFSMNTRRNVRQPKPGELVLREPPSQYFARNCVLGPPKYLN